MNEYVGDGSLLISVRIRHPTTLITSIVDEEAHTHNRQKNKNDAQGNIPNRL